FGITPVEAMACGTPVIGAEVGGIKYTVVDGETGFLVPPDSPGALAERLALVLRHPALRDRLGAEGQRRAHAHFTWKRVAARMAALYDEVASEHRSGTALAGLGPDYDSAGPAARSVK
ncbi:MAG TPA: glycosyltransferase, partial [Trueperaceae bacterium]